MKKIFGLILIIVLCSQTSAAELMGGNIEDPEKYFPNNNEPVENSKLFRNAEIISIVIDEKSFYKNPGVNFFVGEFCVYAESLGKECVINKNVSREPKAIYLAPRFGCQEYLKNNGVWVYKYTEVFFYFIKNLKEKENNEILSFYLDDFESNTTPNSLVYIFREKLFKYNN